MLKAKFIREDASHPPSFRKAYELEEGGPLPRFVVCSAVERCFDHGGPELLIFAADENGKVTDYMDLEGSYRGGTDHEEALRRAGYEVC